MSVSIIACPQCQEMVFSDTAQCPACKQMINQAKNLAATPAADERSLVEDCCKKCGEMVRRGLVRCWSCETFMREDIAASYQKMQAADRPVVYSQTPSAEQSFSQQPVSQQPPSSRQKSVQPDDDDGYELSGGSVQPDDDDDGYELSGGASPQPAAQQTSNTESTKVKEEQPSPAPSDEETAATSDAVPDIDAAALMEIAFQEKQEDKERRKERKSNRRYQPQMPDNLLVFCPSGHRIEVHEKYRGQTGRCPKCKTPFFVPPLQESDGDVANESEAVTEVTGKYHHWMTDQPLHRITPEKLKLKADSLKNDFHLFDLGFSDDELLVVCFTKKKGAVGAKSAKRLAARETLLEELRAKKQAVDLTSVETMTFSGDHLRNMRVVQPAPSAHESLFAGIPVFGMGRIAIRLIPDGEDREPIYLSFLLSEFRRFVELMAEHFQLDDLNNDGAIPVVDSFEELSCHFSQQSFKALEKVEYYEADSAFSLELIGRRCQSCQLTMSEESRKKEKIGGANGRAIAKTKCPTCQQKFGTISLFGLKEEEVDAEQKTDGALETAGKK